MNEIIPGAKLTGTHYATRKTIVKSIYSGSGLKLRFGLAYTERPMDTILLTEEKGKTKGKHMAAKAEDLAEGVNVKSTYGDFVMDGRTIKLMCEDKYMPDRKLIIQYLWGLGVDGFKLEITEKPRRRRYTAFRSTTVRRRKVPWWSRNRRHWW